MKTLIKGGTILNEGKTFKGYIVIDNETITEIGQTEQVPNGAFDHTIDASGCFVLPGVIDTHVHFREPGLEEKGNIESESRAAAYGGVTSYCEMPNTNPQTTSLEALEEKFERARKSSYINYSFFFGATNTNAQLIEKVDIHSIPGIKIFMGASTGNMLVDRISALDSIFENAAKRDLPIMTHCEDSKMISDNMAVAKEQYGEDPPIALHPQIRSEEACYNSSSLAVELALKHKTNVHIAHITTAKELNLLRLPKVKDYVTMEAVIPHLWFAEEDYKTQGARIKCNPAIKKATDREALRKAIADGTITSVGTDHAPHLLEQKEGGAAKATSGMPMVQFSLVSMLELVDKGVLTIERMVELMCHAPAKLFKINHRGFLREQYKADIAIVQPHQTWTVDKDCIQSKCKWSPMEGQTYQWKVVHTICNGHHLYNQGEFDGTVKGQKLSFR